MKVSILQRELTDANTGKNSNSGWSWLGNLASNISEKAGNVMDTVKDAAQKAQGVVQSAAKSPIPNFSNLSAGKTSQASVPVVDNRSKVQAQKPGEFKYGQYISPEEAVAAWDTYNQHAAKNPGEFNYSMQDQLNDIINQINNREKFSYDLNGDALYQQYKNQFTQQGKMAMMDTMGQAQAMTGGYGNSYAQSVGQQAYQSQLQQVNDKIPELYQLALSKYNMEGQELLDKHSLLTDQRDFEYGTHMDKVNAFNTERDRLYNIARDADDTAYNRWYNAEGMRADAHDRKMSEWESAMNREDEEYWNNKSFNYQAEQDKIANGFTQQELDLAQKKFAASLLPSTDPATVDTDPTRAVYAGNDYNGYSFYFDGDKRTFAKGLNPYTGGKNANIEYGAFENGYQPNNLGTYKGEDGKDVTNFLHETGQMDMINGTYQPIYKDDLNGKMWIWDDMQNRYRPYTD